jgi:four helix bundle protein
MKTCSDLLVWQNEMRFAIVIYKVFKSFSKEETFGPTAQLIRSAVTIPSNISRAYGREVVKDYLRFLNIVIALFFELQTQREIAYN